MKKQKWGSPVTNVTPEILNIPAELSVAPNAQTEARQDTPQKIDDSTQLETAQEDTLTPITPVQTKRQRRQIDLLESDPTN